MVRHESPKGTKEAESFTVKGQVPEEKTFDNYRDAKRYQRSGGPGTAIEFNYPDSSDEEVEESE